MIVIAYILINTVAKEAPNVLNKLRKSGYVSDAQAVTGPYDIIATIHAPDIDALGELITKTIQNIEGIDRTLTCIVMQISTE